MRAQAGAQCRRGIHGGGGDIMCVGKSNIFYTLCSFSPPLDRRCNFFAFLDPLVELYNISFFFFARHFCNFSHFWYKNRACGAKIPACFARSSKMQQNQTPIYGKSKHRRVKPYPSPTHIMSAPPSVDTPSQWLRMGERERGPPRHKDRQGRRRKWAMSQGGAHRRGTQ